MPPMAEKTSGMKDPCSISRTCSYCLHFKDSCCLYVEYLQWLWDPWCHCGWGQTTPTATKACSSKSPLHICSERAYMRVVIPVLHLDVFSLRPWFGGAFLLQLHLLERHLQLWQESLCPKCDARLTQFQLHYMCFMLTWSFIHCAGHYSKQSVQLLHVGYMQWLCH